MGDTLTRRDREALNYTRLSTFSERERRHNSKARSVRPSNRLEFANRRNATKRGKYSLRQSPQADRKRMWQGHARCTFRRRGAIASARSIVEIVHVVDLPPVSRSDRKSTRLNSSHLGI